MVAGAGAGLERERRAFGDLLLLHNVREHYHNLTHKARAWVQFLAARRPRTVLKSDDDVALDLAGWTGVLGLLGPHRHWVACRAFVDGPVVRQPRSKWHLSRAEFADVSLGTYCQGMAYALDGRLLPKMASNLRRVQFLWVSCRAGVKQFRVNVSISRSLSRWMTGT